MRYALTSTLLFTLMLAGVASPSAESRAQSQTEHQPGVGERPRDQVKELQGIVQIVDRETRVLRIAHQPTHGRLGSLTDIQRGTRIEASYQDRYGIKVARQIEIVE
jgi:hypothetical protein